MNGLTQAQVVQALGSAVILWSALGEDEDAQVAALLCDDVLARLHPKEGLAARLRELLAVTMDECRTVGTLEVSELLSDRLLRQDFVVERGEGRGEDVIVRFEVVERDGRWCVDPLPMGNGRVIDTVLIED